MKKLSSLVGNVIARTNSKFDNINVIRFLITAHTKILRYGQNI